ncbi:ATP-binding protein [archaeon]|nr:ATP-binding protein [archaeon]
MSKKTPAWKEYASKTGSSSEVPPKNIVTAFTEGLSNDLEKQLATPEKPVEEDSDEEEAEEESNELFEKKTLATIKDTDILGKPVVTIKKIFDKKPVHLDELERETYTCIVDKEGDELYAAIDSDYLDPNAVNEHDIAVYDGGFIVKILQAGKPLKELPKFSFERNKETKNDHRIQVIGGLEKEIELVKDALKVFNPIERKKMMAKGIDPYKAILLHGKSGVGKSMIAQASARYASQMLTEAAKKETVVSFFYVNTPEIFDMYLGRAAREILRIFSTAKKEGNAILYFDEMTRLAARRNYREGGAERETAAATEEWLAQMTQLSESGKNGEDGYVLVMGSTNLAEVFDPAVIRRFDVKIYVPVPGFDKKIEIFKTKLYNVGVSHDLDIREIVSKLEEKNADATGSDIETIVKTARHISYKQNPDKPLTKDDFYEALDRFIKGKIELI